MPQRSFQLYCFIFFSAIFQLFSTSAQASVSVPPALEPWKDWVLQDEKQLDCPWLMKGGVSNASSKEQRWCFWPNLLAIDTQQGGARFRFSLHVYSEGAFPLPGSRNHWPTRVKVNGVSASLTEKDNNPMIHLKKGEHVITGEFYWSKPPSTLKVPTEVALVTLNGKLGTYLNSRDQQLVLSRKPSKQVTQQQDSLRLEVYRLLSDGLPMMLETHLHLQVSGKAREVELGLVAIKDSSLLDIRSPIPARIENNGNLRLQVKPGQYVIVLKSRIAQKQLDFTVKAQTKYWPSVEYWSFKEDTNFRTVSINGAPSIDTSMISIPSQWRRFPTYRLATKDKDKNDINRINIVVNQRGDTSSQENRLNLSRDIWLDFNGTAYTALDQITGSMYQGWRLNSAKGVQLGRASVNGSPVLVTLTQGGEAESESRSGVELRSQNVNLEAVSRIDKNSELLMSGWETLFDKVSVSLHLPPGWKVLHISGAENVIGSWLTKWDLWDLFLVLVLIALTHKLLNIRSAILVAVMLLLSYKLPDSPVAFWPVLLALIGLLSVVSGRWLKGVRVASIITSFLLIITIIGFCVQQLRFAVYPYLEHHGVDTYQTTWGSASQMDGEAMELDEAEDIPKEMQTELRQQVRQYSKSMLSSAPKQVKKAAPINLYQVSDTDRLQTGPGLPNWSWNSVQYSRSGPVSANSSVTIYYVTPWMSRLWHVLSALLVVIVSAMFLYGVAKRWAGKKPDKTNVNDQKKSDIELTEKGFASVKMLMLLGSTFLILTGLLSFSSQIHAQNLAFPPEQVLKTLKERLTQPPECAPYCASMHSAKMEARATELELNFIADVKAPMAIALPSAVANSTAKQALWQATEVRVDNRPAILSRINKSLVISLPIGRHRIRMLGPLVGDAVQVVFPKPIHNLQWSSSAWDVEGLADGRVLGGSLQLTAKPIVISKNAKSRSLTSSRAEDEEAVLVPNAIKPFVVVNRKLVMGKRWTLTTEVVRLAPTKGAFSISIPLLKKEQVLSEFLRIRNRDQKNEALLTFKPNESMIRWESRLDPVTVLKLTAVDSDQFVENWRIVPGSLWNVSYEGILPIKQGSGGGPLNPLWKPWANETLTVTVQRPEGVKGQIQTVESATLNYNAASDVRSATLNLSVRASQGEKFEAGLPQDAKITALYHDGRSLNIPSSNKVVVQLKPGLQQIRVTFQLLKPEGFQFFDHTPYIELANGGANIRIKYQLGRDRWPLYLSGPLIGPAMLFWGVLLVIIAAAVILAWVQKRFKLDMPIKLTGWLLLGIGLSTVNSFGLIFIALFFLLMAFRIKFAQQNGFSDWSSNRFNIMQVGLIGLSLLSLLMLVVAIPSGLLSSPQMQVTGNGSSAFLFNWYQDRIADGEFPIATIVSVPLFIYRIVMLLWSLWLAMQLVKWVVWAWNGFNVAGIWKSTSLSKNADKKE